MRRPWSGPVPVRVTLAGWVWLVTMLLVAVGLFAHASLAQPADPGGGAAPAARGQDAPDGTPAGWRKRRVIRYGGDAWYEPLEWIDSKGNPCGFHVEMIREMGRVLDADVIVTLGPWNEIYAKLLSGEIDVVAMARHPERESVIDFCLPHTSSVSEIYIRKGAPAINRQEDLSGKSVLVERAALAAQVLPRMVPGAKLREQDSQVEVLTRLAAGEGDAAVSEQLTSRLIITRNGLSNLTSTGPAVLTSEYALGVKKGNDALREDLNRALAVVKNTGVFDELYSRHCGQPAAKSLPMRSAVTWGLVIGLPLLGLGIAAVAVSWVMRARVRQAVVTLERELAERQRAESQSRLLLAELDHRVRNTLASIIALVQQSPVQDSTSAERFRAALLDRVMAISASYDAMRKAPAEGVQISAVVAMLTRVLEPDVAARISVEGGSVRLSRENTPHVSLVLHELLSNAASWGALRPNARGSVRISIARPMNKRLVINWLERSPDVTAGSFKPGFGLSIVRGLVEHQLQGEFSWDLKDGGVDCRVDLPTDGESLMSSAMTIEEAARTPVTLPLRPRNGATPSSQRATVG